LLTQARSPYWKSFEVRGKGAQLSLETRGAGRDNLLRSPASIVSERTT
jgi:hypothetical protein